MEDLVTWLRQQLDEDERAARAAAAEGGPDWKPDSTFIKELVDPLPSQRRMDPSRLFLLTPEDAEHIALHDPARVLREVESKRRRLERHQPVEIWAGWDHIPAGEPGSRQLIGLECAWCIVNTCPEECAAYDCRHANREWPCAEIRGDADTFADRPGYQEEWKP